jgi:hypothetical protein
MLKLSIPESTWTGLLVLLTGQDAEIGMAGTGWPSVLHVGQIAVGCPDGGTYAEEAMVKPFSNPPCERSAASAAIPPQLAYPEQLHQLRRKMQTENNFVD